MPLLTMQRPHTAVTTRYDGELLERVDNALRNSGYSTLRRVKVSISRGRVRLAGQVGSYHLKQIAQTAAMSVEGVQELDNRLIVC
jgi:osmotically-inducible protein OsmY